MISHVIFDSHQSAEIRISRWDIDHARPQHVMFSTYKMQECLMGRKISINAEAKRILFHFVKVNSTVYILMKRELMNGLKRRNI